MRILHITFSLLNGGKENLLVDIANEQAALGHDVAIVVIKRDVDRAIVKRISPSVRYFCLGRSRPGVLSAAWLRLLSVLYLKFRPEIIHSHDIATVKILRLLFKGKLACTVHGHGYQTKPLRYYQNIFAVSDGVKREIVEKTGLNCTVIHNGILTKEIVKKNSYVPGSPLRAVCVGRLYHEEKGQDLIFEAARVLMHDRGIQQIQFHLVGAGDSEEFLSALAGKYRLENDVFFEGNRPRRWIYEHLKEYDFFILPSRSEAFGLTVAEAMAAGVPVISSDVDGPAEILENGRFGLLFKNGDAAALADRIEEMMRQIRSGEAEIMAEKAWRHCLENYDIKKTAENYCMAYLP